MENTNCGDKCKFVKAGICKCETECPFYTEFWWNVANETHPRLIKDCFPKRTTYEQNNLLHRNICLQGVVEDVRNRMDRIECLLANLISQSKEFISEKMLEQLISGKEEVKKIDDNRG